MRRWRVSRALPYLATSLVSTRLCQTSLHFCLSPPLSARGGLLSQSHPSSSEVRAGSAIPGMLDVRCLNQISEECDRPWSRDREQEFDNRWVMDPRFGTFGLENFPPSLWQAATPQLSPHLFLPRCTLRHTPSNTTGYLEVSIPQQFSCETP